MKLNYWRAIVGAILFGPSLLMASRPFKIEEMTFSEPGSGPTLIAGDSKGSVWVPLAKRSRIAKVNRSGNIICEFELPDAAYPVGIAVDSKDRVWFSDIKNNRLTRFDADAGEFKNYDIPTKGAWPFEVRIAGDGRIWITERFANKFAVFDPKTEAFREWNVQTASSQPAGLVITDNNDVFFTQNSGHKIGHFNSRTEVYEEIAVPTEMKKTYHYGLAGIDRDKDNNIWFSVLDGKIGFISAKSDYKEVSFVDYPEASARPGGLVIDGRGEIWIGELDGNRIGHYFPSEKKFERFPLPSGSADPEPRAAPEVRAIAQDTGPARGGAPARSEDKAAPVPPSPKTEAPATAQAGGPRPESAAPASQGGAIPAKTTRPFGLLVADDGRIWFTEQYGNVVGTLTVYKSLDRNKLSKEGGLNVHLSLEFEPGKTTNNSHTTVYLVPGQHLTLAKSKGPDQSLMVTEKDGLVNSSNNRDGGVETVFSKKGKFHLVAACAGQTRDITVEVRDSTIPSIVYNVKGRATVPGVVDSAPNGDIWFTDIGGFGIPGLGNLPPGNHIARISADGTVTDYATPTPGSSPTSIKVAKNGAVWFTERLADAIGKWDPVTAQVSEFSLLTKKSAPTGIAIDEARQRVWFTQKSASQIGYLEIGSGKIVEMKTPSRPSEPSTIAVAPDGMIWFDERSQGDVVRFNPESGNFQLFPLSSSEARSIGVTPYSANEGWFLELAANKIGHLDTLTGNIVEYTIPTERAFPFKLARTKDGHIWFTEVFGNKVGRFGENGFVEFRAPLLGSYPGGITLAQNGDIVYALQGGEALVRIPSECLESYWTLHL